jgi:hypothetical protein
MKRKIFVLLILFVGLIVRGQDTCSYLTSACLGEVLKSAENTSFLDEVHFAFNNDTLSVSGMIEANCCGTHLALIEMRHDTIFISTTDTGILCMCDCKYSFKIKVPATSVDTIVNLRGTNYNTKDPAYSSIATNKQERGFSIVPNPANNLITLSIEDYLNGLKEISILNSSGMTLKKIPVGGGQSIDVDLSKFESGVYFVKIETMDSKSITQKLIKK